MNFAINALGTCGGVQVTASHNPAKYNDFKIFGLDAKSIGADTGLEDVKHITMTPFPAKGKLSGKIDPVT